MSKIDNRSHGFLQTEQRSCYDPEKIVGSWQLAEKA